MALQSSGSISLSDIATEFGGTPPHSMSEYFGQGNAPGNGNAIGLGLHFYGTSNRVVINLTISANTNNYNIWNSKGGSYAAGNTDVILTINSGVAVGSAGINSYALDTGTGWNANDTITIIHNGTIIGKGGNGGNGTPNKGGPGGIGRIYQYSDQIPSDWGTPGPTPGKWFAGGGGGASDGPSYDRGAGGAGGGGSGYGRDPTINPFALRPNQPVEDGTISTCGGGGGHNGPSSPATSGGGSGIIIIRY